MEETKTVKEVLEDVVKMLSGIKVPMSEIDSIGLPVARSISAINACLNALIEPPIDLEAKEESEPMMIEEVPQE